MILGSHKSRSVGLLSNACFKILVSLIVLQGYVFVDRDGKNFRHILNWMRDGVVPMLKDSEYLELLREAEYYQLLVSQSFCWSRFACPVEEVLV